MTIARTAFDAIAERLTVRKRDFARLASTEYSFEEWFNYEAFLACERQWKGESVSPRPRYSVVGSKLSRFGLLVSPKLCKLLVEVGILHAKTGSKWERKIEADAKKLATIKSAQALQLVVVVAPRAEGRKATLARLRNRVTRFSTRPRYETRINIGNQTAHLFGWTEH